MGKINTRHHARIRYNQNQAVCELTNALLTLYNQHGKNSAGIMVLCIGTDRSTGDSLGPLVGSKLAASSPGFLVRGTLEQPVHAANLAETLSELRNHHNWWIVAVDASLGNADSVGTVNVGLGSLQPGAGVNKKLPPVGSVYITGTVNVGGFMEYFVLQNTRLSLVIKMADLITEALISAFAPSTKIAGQ